MLSRLRRFFRDLSIERKLMLIVTLTSGLALVLACAGFVRHDMIASRAAMQESSNTLATIVARTTAAALEFDDERAATEVLATLKGNPDVISAILYRGGLPFARYDRTDDEAVSPAATLNEEFSRFVGNRLELARIVAVNDTPRGMLYVVTDLSPLEQRLRRYIQIAATLLLVAMFAAWLLASGFQRVISRPVSELVRLTRRVSAEKDYSMRVQRHSRDELGALFDGFNDMLAQIQQRDSALQSAHEDLERRVVERTRELQQQVAERLAAEKALQQQLTRISLLNQIASALSDRQDLDRIVRVVLAQLEEHLSIDFGSVSIFHTGRGQLEIAAARRRGQPPERVHHSLAPFGPLEDALGAYGDCRSGQQIYFSDTATSRALPLRRFSDDGLRSVVAVPLMVERRLFGLLIVARADPDAFTTGECEFLRMLGEQVAVAGSQAHLYSELQRAYTELRQSQLAMMQQERLRALGQMASGIAHDINNTLTPIVTFAELLLEHEPGLTEHARNCLVHIQTAGNDIASIVTRLREFYRPRDTQERLAAIDVHALLTQLADLTRPRWRDMPQARGAVIELRTDFAPDVLKITGHPTEIRESITNLILNAVDAMPDGGTLTFRTRLRHTPGARDGFVLIEVIDTGIGMDEHTRERCVEPFFSTKGHRGTGLGLAMVYGVMERHGGRIEVESNPGAGTTMRLVFPLPTAAALESAHPFNVDDLAAQSLRILCVDDEPMLRVVLLDLFKTQGHDVSAADGGEIGLELFRQAQSNGRPYDVVVTDLGMPHMDGRQFAQLVKRESPRTPVILLTGWGRIIQEQGERLADIDAVLTKPPRPADVRRTLRQVISKPPR